MICIYIYIWLYIIFQVSQSIYPPECQLGAGIDLVDIVVARMVEVVADAGHQQDQTLQVAQAAQQIRLARYGIHL